jgi:hypothetical protein
MTEAQYILGEPMRRLKRLYSCREEGTGRVRPFVPRPEQLEVFRLLEEKPTEPVYIIKSRRLGLSTALCTYQVDKAVFSRGWRGILIDQTQADATKKMEEIIRFSLDNLPPEILDCYEFPKKNDTQIRLRIAGEENDTQDSVIYATTSGRGGDCSMLHVSEWGPIQATDAKRSAEIRSGSFPAARMGRRAVETTWMGGKAGDLWELIEPILENNPHASGTLLFFPWHSDPAAIQLTGQVPAAVEDYFFALASRLGKTFSQEQKLWWTSKKLEQGLFMSREYPSTLEEAFQAPIEGAVYAKLIDDARTEKRVTPLPHDNSHLTWTFWDIGSPRNTRLIYVQFIGHTIHIIDHDDGTLEMTPGQRVSHMLGKGYNYAGHFLPHDGDNTTAAGSSFRQQLAAAGLPSVRCLPRCHREWDGVNKAAEILPRCWFDEAKTKQLLDSLSYYHTKKDMRDGAQTDILVDDWSAHDADAFRMLAEALLNNRIPSTSPVVQQLRPSLLRQKTATRGRFKP